MRASRLLALCAVLGATTAAGQSYVVSTASAPYTALTNPTVISLTGNTGAGYANVPLGFDFPFFGASYNAITVTTDGMAYFQPSPGASTYQANVALPSSALPNGVLAPFWDDLRGGNPFSQLAYQLTQTASGKVLAIEWKDWNHWSTTATYDLDFQLLVHENGLIQFHYGQFTGGGQTLTATVGIENPAGTQGVTALSCSPNCAAADLAPGQIITFGPGPNTVDLIAGRLVIDQISQSGNLLTLETQFDVQNFGTLDADIDAVSGEDRRAEYSLYLSSDTALDASDVPLSPSTQGPFAVPAMGRTTHTATSTVTAPSSGTWYLLAKLDPANTVSETSETNNLASSSPLVSGTDLVAQSIVSSVSLAGPGEPITNTLEFANIGLNAAGAVPWRILLSKDNAVDASDLVVATGSTQVNGGQNVTQSVTYNLPSNVPSGDYWFVLQLDPANVVVELSDTNNAVFSQAQFTSRQADLVIGAPALFDVQPPYAPASAACFGEPFRMQVTVTNVGGATAGNFSVVAYLSENDVLNALSDPEAGEATGLSLAPGASTTVVLNGTVPATNVLGTPFQPGGYFLFAAAVSNGSFVEISQANNVDKLGPVRVLDPAPDLVPLGVLGPLQGAPGEIIPVHRVLKNAGNRPSPAAAYRFYLSANDTVTEQDLLLPIVLPQGGTADSGTVTLAVGQTDAATEWVQLPKDVVPGTWRLGVLLDPPDGTAGGAVPEIDEANNGFAGAAIGVVPARLELVSTELPDAIAGVPFQFRLSTRGGALPVGFELPDPSELPDGLSLSTEGDLSGTASAPGVWPFTIRAKDAQGRELLSRLVFRAVPNAGALTLTATRLPAPVKDGAYRAWLSAQGGKAPYRWTLVSGELPEGLELDPSGRLSGLVTGEVGASSTFTLRATDAVGNAAQAAWTLTVIAPGALYIQVPALPAAQVGADFAVDLVAKTAGSAPLDGPVEWALVKGRLPEGVTLQPQSDVAVLRGIPARAGVSSFTIQVTDAKGRVDTADLVLSVVPVQLRLVSTVSSILVRGMAPEGQVTFEGGAPGHFERESGDLPPGLSVKDDGTFAGTVADDAPLRIYSFTVRGRTAEGAQGVLPMAIEVAQELPTPASGCGCNAAAVGANWAWLLAAVAVAARRKRR